ncbi:MAG: PA2779 family protein [Aquisalimonadaceae bacterium]
MSITRNARRFIAMLIASVFLLTSVGIPAAQAGMIGTQTFASSEQVESQRQAIMDMLKSDDVRTQLVSWGVEPADAEQRVNSLTAEEVQALHERMDEMPAGADSLVGAVVFVFLVLLITDILGYTNIFPFTKSAR